MDVFDPSMYEYEVVTRTGRVFDRTLNLEKALESTLLLEGLSVRVVARPAYQRIDTEEYEIFFIHSRNGNVVKSTFNEEWVRRAGLDGIYFFAKLEAL